MQKHRYIVFIFYLTVFKNPDVVQEKVEYEKPITEDDIKELWIKISEGYNKNQYPCITGILKLEETPS